MVAIITALLSLATTAHQDVPLLVLFGRPGAGKSVIANGLLEKVEEKSNNVLFANHRVLGLDLDVCVPQWMRDNFAKGIYPSLQERQEFALSACDYVERSIEAEKETSEERKIATIVAFSFVNTDLRDTFRLYFPQTKWVLMDTNEDEAKRRIDLRQGHFYKGRKVLKTVGSRDESDVSTSQNVDSKLDADNSDWAFAPVSFPHDILDGNAPVGANVEKVFALLRQLLDLD